MHAFGGEGDPLRGGLGGAKGYMVDAALGTTDAVEWSSAGRAGFYPWYATLNNGLRVTAIGGEDSISNLHRSKLVGSVRTYVYTGSAGSTCTPGSKGSAKGRAFVSTGPLVELTVNGRMPGEEVELPASGGDGRGGSPRAVDRALGPRSCWSFNGNVIDRSRLRRRPQGSWISRSSYPVRRSGWFHLRAEGKPEDRYPLDTGYPPGLHQPGLGHGRRPPGPQPAGGRVLDPRGSIRLQKMAEAWPGWRSDKEKAHVFCPVRRGTAVYQRLAAEADAISAARGNRLRRGSPARPSPMASAVDRRRHGPTSNRLNLAESAGRDVLHDALVVPQLSCLYQLPELGLEPPTRRLQTLHSCVRPDVTRACTSRRFFRFLVRLGLTALSL